MESTQESGSRNRIRQAAVVAGILAILVGAFGDGIGWPDPRTFGRSQQLMVLLGIALAVGGTLGRRAGRTYVFISVQTVSVLLLLMGLDLAAGLLLTGSSEGTESVGPTGSVDLAGPTSALSLELEAATGVSAYVPYVLWRARDHQGTYINVRDGLRRTLPEPATCSRTLWIAGGSTVWGWGVADSATIPSQVARRAQLAQEPACVTNLGQNAYISTQEAIAVEQRLRAGLRPTHVVVYSGFNDMWATWEAGAAGVHFMLRRIRGRLEAPSDGGASLVRQLIERSNLYAWAVGISDGGGSDNSTATRNSDDIERLARATVAYYLANLEVLSALGDAYDFDVAFAWQPNVWSTGKVLTDAERHWQSDPRLGAAEALFARVDELIRHHAETEPRLFYLGDVFDHTTSEVFTDYVHVTDEGNRIVAERLLEIVRGAT